MSQGKQSRIGKLLMGDIDKTVEQKVNKAITDYSLSNSMKFQPVTRVVYTSGVSRGRQEFDPEIGVIEGYKLNPTFFAGVDRITKNVDLVEWFVEVETTDGNWEIDNSHELNKILALPDPKRKLSFDSLVKASIIFLKTGGNFVWHKVRTGKKNTGKVTRWELLPLASVKPFVNKRGYIEYYEYTTEETTHRILPKDIIHGREFDPADMNWGLSPLKVLAETVDTDNAAQAWNKHAMDNHGVPDGMFVYEGVMEQEEYDEAYDQLQEQYQGVKNAHKALFLPANTKYVQLALTPVEMDWLNSRKFNAIQIAKVLGVPAPLLGEMEAATYNNLEQYKKSLWEDAVIPCLNLIMDAVNLDLLEEYKSEPRRVRINYSLANVPVLREDYGAKLSDALKLSRLGVPIKEINRILDLGISDDVLTEMLEKQSTQTQPT